MVNDGKWWLMVVSCFTHEKWWFSIVVLPTLAMFFVPATSPGTGSAAAAAPSPRSPRPVATPAPPRSLSRDAPGAPRSPIRRWRAWPGAWRGIGLESAIYVIYVIYLCNLCHLYESIHELKICVVYIYMLWRDTYVHVCERFQTDILCVCVLLHMHICIYILYIYILTYN